MKLRNVEIALMGYFDGEVSPFHPKVIAAFMLCPRFSRRYLRELRDSHNEFVTLIAQKKDYAAAENKTLVNDIFRQLPHCLLTSEVPSADFGNPDIRSIKNIAKNRGAKFAHFGKGFMIGSLASAALLISLGTLNGALIGRDFSPSFVNYFNDNIATRAQIGSAAKQLAVSSKTLPEVSANAEYFDAAHLVANYSSELREDSKGSEGLSVSSPKSFANQRATVVNSVVNNTAGHNRSVQRSDLHASVTLANNTVNNTVNATNSIRGSYSDKTSGNFDSTPNNSIYFRYQPSQSPADAFRITHESLTWEDIAR